LRSALRSGSACHYLQAVGDVLLIFSFLEQTQALLAQRLYPFIFTFDQRGEG
jgi:hypothetical protein